MPFSIVVPTLNEAATIATTIESLRRQGRHEIVVVDGGSTDDTLPQARGADLVLTSARGRANQMNAGAACAAHEFLLFLHADCTLQEGALSAAEHCLRTGTVAGCFSMRVAAPGPLFRAIDWCATARVRLTGLMYGDQGMFLLRDSFEAVAGFPPLRFMEDVFISRALRRLGRPLVLPQHILVSPRRWRSAGLIRQTLRNWTLTALAAAGVHPDDLARFYPSAR